MIYNASLLPYLKTLLITNDVSGNMYCADDLHGDIHKFNLRGNNFLTRIVKKIWKFLNVCV